MELSSISILNNVTISNRVIKETLSDRIKRALERLSITQTELARKIGVKQQIIQYLCNSKTKTSIFTYKIADALKINPLWLATGVGYMFLEDDLDYQLIKSQKKIPLVTTEHLKNIIQNKLDITKITVQEWILTDGKLGKGSYAISLKDQSMMPRFEEGILIVFDAQIVPKNKDYVLAHLSMTNEIIFRQLIKNRKESILQPLNTHGYKAIKMSGIDKIYGVMREARWSY
jgi:transcriptional regulator with XRE-family HTH domain